MFALLACSMLFLGSCDDDDDKVEDVVELTFRQRYPTAQKVEWRNESGYRVANFVYDAKQMEAWFRTDGVWEMAETDLTYSQLPTAVQEGFRSGLYANWTVESVDMLERVNVETVYILKVENADDMYGLYYVADGSLIREVPDLNDDYMPLSVPAGVINEVRRIMPNARFIDFAQEGSNYRVYVIDGNIYKRVLLDSNHAWMSTEWGISMADVPQAVRDGLNASIYANDNIEGIEAMQRGNDMLYVFRLMHQGTQVYVTINSEGIILQN